MYARIRNRLARPVAPYSLAVFRILFGGLMLVLVARYFYYGWIPRYFTEPDFFFKYYGFAWVRVLPEPWIYLLFVLIGLGAAGILLGYRTRVASLLFFLSFTYAHLMDVTVYLNHYYLVSLLAGLCCFLPSGAVWSLDARAGRVSGPVRLVHIQMLRLQIGLVYFFGGVAKLNHDWLFAALPMKLWLGVRTDFPLLGPLFHFEETAFVFSWAGMIFDLTAFALLMSPATRRFAYAVVIVFHVMTSLLFEIGMFPWIMVCGGMLFFDPDWPARILARLRNRPVASEPVVVSPSGSGGDGERRPRWRFAPALLALYFTFQILFPLRNLLYGGNVAWHEQGFRFAWQVMVMQKSGHLEYRVMEPGSGREVREDPGRYLSRLQRSMLNTQPDLILQYAHHLGERYRSRGWQDVEVRAVSRVSLNGRGGVPLIDPAVDLLAVREGWAPKRFIRSAPPLRTRAE